MDEWISVKDRLPEAVARVLLWAPGLAQRIGWRISEAARAGIPSRPLWRMDDEQGTVFSDCWFTHWHPLPNPPVDPLLSDKEQG